MLEKKLSRRDLIKGALGVAAFTIVPRHVLGGRGYVPPSEMLTRGIIGVGNMGMNHVAQEGAILLALADVDRRHLRRGFERAQEKGERPALYNDFRELLERKDIDVVHIVTPPHWHAIMAIMAVQAGKDIVCEKPMTRTIGEGIKVVEAVHAAGRIARVHTFGRLGGEWYGSEMTVTGIKKLMAAQVFGWPCKMTLGKSTGFDWKTDQWSGDPKLGAQPVPRRLDYDMWLGPAPYKPYHEERVHEKFRGYWDYDGGGLGDMGQHYLDPAQYVLDKDETSPVEIECDVPQQHTDAVGQFRTIRMKYADGCEIIIDGTESEKQRVPLIEGPKGKLYKGYTSDEIPNLKKILSQLPEQEPIQKEFYQSVKTRTRYILNEDVCHRSCNLINLAKISMQTGRPLRFDPVKQNFIGDEEANRLINEPMRGPWHV